jgi:hypothetical protein
MDVIRDLKIEINDNVFELRGSRVPSSFFYTGLPEDNIFDLPSGRRRVISDGYWIFFKPQGQHLKISSFGSCSQGITILLSIIDHMLMARRSVY